MMATRDGQDDNRSSWDHSTHEAFLRYYEEEHLSDQAAKRFAEIRNTVLRALARGDQVLDVLDIGCGPGTQSLVWAELGHRVRGLDVSEQFISVAKRRVAATGFAVDFRVGSAASLPWADESVDVCLAVELLEHID